MTIAGRHDVPFSHAGLVASLGLGSHEHIAIVGGGGKTTLLHALGSQLEGSRVLTCTTKMGHDQDRGLPVLVGATDAEIVSSSATRPVMVWAAIDGHKAVGVEPEVCDRWFSLVDHVVAEADGSRRRPFKAPADYEPVVASTVTVMVSVIGADALGQRISDQCHRPDRVAALARCSVDDPLTPRRAATVLAHPDGARKELPAGARFVVVITKADDQTGALVDDTCAELASMDPAQRIVVVSAP